MPSADIVIPYGPNPAAIVGIAKAVKAPVLVLRLYIEILPLLPEL